MKNPKNMCVYIGSPGCGKTFICAALTEWSFVKFGTRRYHKEESILRTLRNGISESNGDYLIALQYLIDDDFVILDDVASGINADRASHRDLEFRREIFLSFLDYRYNTQKPTLITSNFTRQNFKDVFSERIASRLFAKENTIIEAFGDDLDKRSQGM